MWKRDTIGGWPASWAESGHHRVSDHLQVGIDIVFRTDRRRDNQAGSGINIFAQACLAAIGITGQGVFVYQLAEVLGVLYAKLVGGVFHGRIVVFVYSSEDEEAKRNI